MSKKTILSVLVLILFVFIAIASSSSQGTSSPSYSGGGSSNSSSSSKSYLKPTEFPKTAERCPSCYGGGCAKCNYKGVVLR